ncbi:hypothetical protein [Micromonospora sp. LOL_024]|uniref:hypothetical protein n=1 Tax=Micromonospora sp. LOL_024 TaxID=3345412 RepID=UPI003A8A5EC2
MKRWTSRVLATVFLGLTGVFGIAGPAHAGFWVHNTTTAYSEAGCHAAGAAYEAHYCTFTTYPKDCGRCGVRGWYLSYWIN